MNMHVTELQTITEKMQSGVDGNIGHLIFNNPAKHNAVSLDMWEGADAILDAFQNDPDIRVVVVSGNGGKSFVSGADISEFEKSRGSEEAVAHYNSRTRQLYNRLEQFPKPTIAMIRGYCIGGGLNLACCCDLRFCTEGSSFAMPAAKLALGYPFEAVNRLMALMGPANGRDLMYSARRIDAETAMRFGLVQAVVSDEELEDFTKDYAETVGRNAPLTVQAMKFISGQVLAQPDARDLAACDTRVAACFASEDYKEGRRAFMEKRKPEFQGK